MSDRPPLINAGKPISLLAVGEFGAAVAARFKDAHAQAQIISEPAESAEIPLILPSWREPRRLARAVETARSVPWWIPVVYAHPVIRVGPVLGRDLPGCYGCLTTRELSLKKDPRVTEALWDLYDADTSAGLAGHLAHHATIAAGLTLGLTLERPGDHRALYAYDVLTGDVAQHVFSPLPRCPGWPAETPAEGVRHAHA